MVHIFEDGFVFRVSWVQLHLLRASSKQQEMAKLMERYVSLKQPMWDHKGHILLIALLLYLLDIMHYRGRLCFLKGPDSLSANSTWRLETVSLVLYANSTIQERGFFLLQTVSWVQLDFPCALWVRLLYFSDLSYYISLYNYSCVSF